MKRVLILCTAAAVVWPAVAMAQQTGPRLDSPGEIAVWSTVLTQKKDYCRRQAKAMKLSYLKRRRFIRHCMKQ